MCLCLLGLLHPPHPSHPPTPIPSSHTHSGMTHSPEQPILMTHSPVNPFLPANSSTPPQAGKSGSTESSEVPTDEEEEVATDVDEPKPPKPVSQHPDTQATEADDVGSDAQATEPDDVGTSNEPEREETEVDRLQPSPYGNQEAYYDAMGIEWRNPTSQNSVSYDGEEGASHPIPAHLTPPHPIPSHAHPIPSHPALFHSRCCIS